MGPATAERVLVVFAHPDDVDFGAAGTVATWVGAGATVSYCVVTNGDAGGFDREVSRQEMVGIRQAEQRAAAAAVGVSEVVFLGYPDGRLTPSFELRRDIARVIRQVRPDRLLTHSPERNFERIYASHPDHLAVGEAALCAVYPDARNPFAHPELAEAGLEPHTVAEVWLMAAPAEQAVHAVEVSAVVDQKLAALRCHTSQVAQMDGLETMIRGWLEAVAAGAGLPPGSLAEGFRVVQTG